MITSTQSGLFSSRILLSWSDAKIIAQDWDALAKRVGASVYLSPSHVEIWWKHYGRGDLVIVECRASGRLVGVLPFFISTLVVGVVPVRVAKLLTSDSTIVALTPPVELEYAQLCWAAAIHALMESNAEVFTFSPLSGEDGYSTEARAAISSAGLRILVDRSPVPCTVFNLPESISSYYASLKAQPRKNYKRALRHIQSMGRYEIRFSSDVDYPEYFERFICLHTDRWIAGGALGHFGDWPGSIEYNADLVHSHAARGEVLFLEVCLDGSVIGSIYAFIYGSRVFARLNARMTGDIWGKARLGNIIQSVLIEHLLGRGLHRIESGPGHYQHKLEAGGMEFPLISLVACRKNIVSTIKAFMLVAWSNLLHYAYYRGWRARILPKLGIKPGPLWRIWIRTRL